MHTPGPWTAEDLSDPVNDPCVMSAKHCIATVWINDISRKSARDNARLAAAAPDLLEAVTELLATHPAAYREAGHIDNRTDNAVRVARAAIAKATGAT